MKRRNFFAALAGGIAALFGVKAAKAEPPTIGCGTGYHALLEYRSLQTELAKNIAERNRWRMIQGFYAQGTITYGCGCTATGIWGELPHYCPEHETEHERLLRWSRAIQSRKIG